MTIKELIIWLLNHPLEARVDLTQPGGISIELPDSQKTLTEYLD